VEQVRALAKVVAAVGGEDEAGDPGSILAEATEFAMSSVVPRRETGIRRRYSWTVSSLPTRPAARSVGTRPGATAFTRMLCSPRSSAAQRVSMLSPAFATQ
jgi:hypothetical protein